MKKIKRFGYTAAAAGVLCVLIGMIAFTNSRVNVTEGYDFDSADVIVIFAEYSEINIEKGDSLRVEFNRAGFDGNYSATLADGRLYVACEPDLPWYRRLASSVLPQCSVTIRVPEGYENRIFTGRKEDGRLDPVER